MTVRLTRVYRFAASHRLHSEGMSASANAELYGKCNNPFGHGHNYVLEVSVSGPVCRNTGRVVDLCRLDQLVGRKVVQALDHRDLNADVPEFGKLVPTTENLAAVIEKRLRNAWEEGFPEGAPRLASIRIYETDRNIFELASL